MVPLVLGQVQSLIEKVPEWLDKLAPRAKEWFNIDISTAAVLRQIKNLNSDVKGVAQNVAGNVLGFGTAILGAIFQLATIALFTFYFVADGPRMRRAICSTLPPSDSARCCSHGRSASTRPAAICTRDCCWERSRRRASSSC